MRVVAWMIVGWLLLVFQASAGPRMLPWRLCPDVALIVITFVAMRNDIFLATVTAACLGLIQAHLAAAPESLFIGLDVLMAVVTFRLTGQFVGRGVSYAALMAGAITFIHRICMMLILTWRGETVGYASFVNALLFPDAIATSALAACFYPCLLVLERTLDDRRQSELTWR